MQPVAVNKEQVTSNLLAGGRAVSPGGCAGPHDLWHGCRGGTDRWEGCRVHPSRLQATWSLPGSHSPVPPGPPLGREEGVCVESTEGGGGGGVERIRTPFSVGPRVPGGAVPSCHSPPQGGLCPGSLGAALEGPWPRCSPRGEEGWSGVVRTCAPLRVGAPPLTAPPHWSGHGRLRGASGDQGTASWAASPTPCGRLSPCPPWQWGGGHEAQRPPASLGEGPRGCSDHGEGQVRLWERMASRCRVLMGTAGVRLHHGGVGAGTRSSGWLPYSSKKVDTQENLL